MKRFELTDLADVTIAKLEAEGIRVFPRDVLAIQALSLKASGSGVLLKGRAREVGGIVFWPLTIGASCWFSDFLSWLEDNQQEAPIVRGQKTIGASCWLSSSHDRKSENQQEAPIVFWPLTIGASCWFSDFLSWLEDNPMKGGGWDFFAFAYASAHSRDRRESGKPFAFGFVEKAAFDEIRKWKRSLMITEAELLDAIEGTMAETICPRIIDDDDDVQISGQHFDRSDLATMLVAQNGGNLDSWLWTTDIPTALEIIKVSLNQKARERGIPTKEADGSLEGLKALSDYCAEMRQRRIKARQEATDHGAEN